MLIDIQEWHQVLRTHGYSGPAYYWKSVIIWPRTTLAEIHIFLEHKDAVDLPTNNDDWLSYEAWNTIYPLPQPPKCYYTCCRDIHVTLTKNELFTPVCDNESTFQLNNI